MPAYGNSMIVDPWGEILARAPGGDEETFITADLDFDRLREVRERLPSLANRVPGAYRWPQEVNA
jgi:predicted amidohydrolase